MVDVLKEENSIVQKKFCTKKKNALGKNIMHSLKVKLLLLVLITTVTVTPIIAILKQMSKLYKEKRVPQNEMGICFILGH